MGGDLSYVETYEQGCSFLLEVRGKVYKKRPSNMNLVMPSESED
jgi:hypothetical protein